MIWLAVALLLPIGSTYFVVRGLISRGEGSRLLSWSAALGLGIGASSALFFLWLSLAARYMPAWALDVAVFGCAAGVGIGNVWRGRQGAPNEVPATTFAEPRWLRWSVSLACLLVVAAALGALVNLLRHSPYGDFDAVAIWNLRARFLYRGGPAHWRAGFTPELNWSHPDYPLLLPGAVARCWYYQGHETTLAPALLALLFTSGTVALLYAVLARERDRLQGLLGAAVLAGTGLFLESGSAQYADVPLGYFALLTVVFLVLAEDAGAKRRPLLLLAAFSAGLAAWTKNEGILFALVIAGVHGIMAWRVGGFRSAWRDMAWAGLGFLPMALILMWFKISFAPANDLLARQSWSQLRHQLTDPARYVTILRVYLDQLMVMGGGMVFFLAGYRLLLGRCPRERGATRTSVPTLVVLAMLAGFFLIYLTTYWDLAAHLYYSVDRLFVQLYSTALLAFFLAAASPTEAWRRY